MKKLLEILVLGLLWCNLSFSETVHYAIEFIDSSSYSYDIKIEIADSSSYSYDKKIKIADSSSISYDKKVCVTNPNSLDRGILEQLSLL